LAHPIGWGRYILKSDPAKIRNVPLRVGRRETGVNEIGDSDFHGGDDAVFQHRPRVGRLMFCTHWRTCFPGV
jgi:hypothetical protein